MKFVGPLYISQTFKISPLISIYWHRYHRQFVDASRERYFRNINFLSEIHSNIADYFLGIWGGRPKPFEYSELQRQRFFLDDVKGEEDRKVITWSLTEASITTKSGWFIETKKRYILTIGTIPWEKTKVARTSVWSVSSYFKYALICFKKLRGPQSF